MAGTPKTYEQAGENYEEPNPFMASAANTDTIPIGQIDVDFGAIGLEASANITRLGEGFNSQALLVGSEVVKISKRRMPQTQAQEHMTVLIHEHELIRRFVGDYMPDTRFETMPTRHDPEYARAVTIQPFVAGISFKDLVIADTDTQDIQQFLKRASEMYRETGQVPDLANIETFFNIFRNSNLVIQPEENCRPFLVDTNFGKLQRSKALGGLWSRAIARGIRRGLAELQEGK